eukprot:TRINITY_DN4854_c0_g1_i4.p1 TRINITY_DN4854_c0_g1~~TRINITY_DN4854_c0_g1_i4.p1  ORF type:complete len:117 (-),score=14.18 TRINITY_DN4854_c0_g1_i4:108-458(-)
MRNEVVTSHQRTSHFQDENTHSIDVSPRSGSGLIRNRSNSRDQITPINHKSVQQEPRDTEVGFNASRVQGNGNREELKDHLNMIKTKLNDLQRNRSQLDSRIADFERKLTAPKSPL